MNIVKPILQLEGAVILAASVWLYFVHLDGGWLLAPDLSMVGFLKDARLGSATYNLMHNYILAGALILAGVSLDMRLLTLLGLILAAHVGMDRALAYGLKYPTHFKDTHMQRV